MLEIQQVSFAYPGHAPVLKNVSLSIQAGEFIGLAGRNGSGKTTLTRLMVGLGKPASGQVMLDGKPAKDGGPAVMARSVGYVFQNPDRQIFRDTVASEVAYGPEQMDWSDDERQAAVDDALAMTGLIEVAQAYPRGLARSFRQRIAIASALALKPRLLILDEPTSGQDAEEKKQLMQLLGKLNRQGIGVILVTHDMEMLLEHTRRTVVLHQGEKVYDGPTQELFADPAHDVGVWGLRVPDVAAIAAKFTKITGAVRSVEELAASINQQLGGKTDEKPGASV
ncbi:MAG TPA: ABC transporter ATP-binding protein [Negativicutes bacterium]|nr:ABC transporter ATP-binding protein [Negativicutes bacterium]